MSKYTRKTLMKKTATEFQRLVRAKAGAYVGDVPCVVYGEYTFEPSRLGFCVCVTCGFTARWDSHKIGGNTGIDAGHFIQGKRASVVFEPSNVHCQCATCNGPAGSNPNCYTLYMRETFGQEEIDRLMYLHNRVSVTWAIDELEAMGKRFRAETREAIKLMRPT